MLPDCTVFHSREGDVHVHRHEDLIRVLLGRGSDGLLFYRPFDYVNKERDAVCSLGGTNRSFKCSMVIPNFSQIFLCSDFPYAVGLPLSSTPSVPGAVLFFFLPYHYHT